jgi:hypothetical protein
MATTSAAAEQIAREFVGKPVDFEYLKVQLRHLPTAVD